MADPLVDYPFISVEEKALKAKLQGLTVYDLKDPARPVNVFYRNPPKEIEVGDFPFLTIYYTGIARDVEREHRAIYGVPQYVPWGIDRTTLDESDATTVLIADAQAIPYVLNFTIATHARNPMHDRQIVTQLLALDYLPFRYGWLEVDDDNTIRRLDVNRNILSNDFFDQSGNPIFRKEFNISVSGEQWLVPPEQVAAAQVVNIEYGDVP